MENKALENMILNFKIIKTDEVKEVYDLYCEEEKIDKNSITELDYIKAEKIYKSLREKGSYTLGAYVSNLLVGVVTIYKNMQFYPFNLDNPYIHLECVIIKRGYQNIGIGTELITEAIKRVKAEGCTYIIGQSYNSAMQKVFYKAGLTNTSCKDFRFESF